MMSYQRSIAGLALCAVVALSLPLPSLAVSAPSAQTILKQSFANLENASSYDVNGSIGIVLPKSTRSQLTNDDLGPYLVGGKELRGYFNGTFDKKSEAYQFTATSYNVQTGESPRIDVVGNKKGLINFRVGGITQIGLDPAQDSSLAKYLGMWIRIDSQSFPGMMNPVLMPVLGTQSQAISPVSAPVSSSNQTTFTEQTGLTAAEAKKIEAVIAKIKKAFWSRNVIIARRLADAKDHTGAPAYRLSLKLNPIGARLFVLDVTRIAGEKPSVSDLKELNKFFSRLPVFAGDLVVSKITLLPEVMNISVSNFEKKKADDSSVLLKVSFEHVGSGREIVMPTDFKRFDDIVNELNRPVSVSVSTSTMPTSTSFMPLGGEVDPATCVIVGGCAK